MNRPLVWAVVFGLGLMFGAMVVVLREIGLAR